MEYERLKLEEQISMLEKVIEEGIKQTTELQEIHHSEVEDLHKQVCSKKFQKIQKFRRKSQKFRKNPIFERKIRLKNIMRTTLKWQHEDKFHF